MWNLIFLNETDKTETDSQISKTNLWFTKQTHRYQKQTYGYQRGKVGGGEGTNQELGINIHTLLYIK